MLSKSQLANYINCQLGQEDLGCLTNFCTAVASCISTSAITANLKAATSAGILFESANGTDVALFGAGNGAGATFYGGVLLNTMTAGSVFFSGSGGLISQDNANFFRDDTNNRLGLLTAAPTHSLTLGSTSTGIRMYNTADQTTNFDSLTIQASSNIWYIRSGQGGTGTVRSIVIGSTSTGDAAPTTNITYTANAITANLRSTGSASPGFVVSLGSNSISSGTIALTTIGGTINQSGTAGFTILDLNYIETATGSGAKNFLLCRKSSGSTLFGVNSSGAISIGNTVNTETLVSNRSVTIDISGTTYKLLAYV